MITMEYLDERVVTLFLHISHIWHKSRYKSCRCLFAYKSARLTTLQKNRVVFEHFCDFRLKNFMTCDLLHNAVVEFHWIRKNTDFLPTNTKLALPHIIQIVCTYIISFNLDLFNFAYTMIMKWWEIYFGSNTAPEHIWKHWIYKKSNGTFVLLTCVTIVEVEFYANWYVSI